MAENHTKPKSSPRNTAVGHSTTPNHTKHIAATKSPAKHISVAKSPAKQTSSSKSQSKQIPATNTRAQRIPSRPRPQSQYAYSCPQPRFFQSWPWSQHYGKDTWPWEREGKLPPSPKKRQVRASSDTAATCRMSSSMYATERPSTAHCVYEGGVFGPSSHAPKRDFFVIHPDWVSEADTVKKLTHAERRPRPIVSRPARRCRSAPPPRLRNPITWED